MTTITTTGHRLTGQNITCIRGEKTVFSRLNFDLPPGRALILQGANGAGKSSLLKIIAGLLPCAAGQVHYGSTALLQNRDIMTSHIGYLAHKNGLKPDMTVAENLLFWTKMMQDGDAENHPARISNAVAKMRLIHCLDLPVSDLSSGLARRAALARLLCQQTSLWLLDEPAVGLDQTALEALTAVMQDHLRQGGSIMVATHTDLGLDPAYSQRLDMTAFSDPLSKTLLPESLVLESVS